MRSGHAGSGKTCGRRKEGTTPRQLLLRSLERRAVEREQKAEAEKNRRREVERRRKAVLRKLRRRKERASSSSSSIIITPRPLVDIAELFTGADGQLLTEIAALLNIGAPAVDKVARASQQSLGGSAARASKVSGRIGRNIAAVLAPLLAGLLRLLDFQGNPDPLGCFRLVLKNRRFRQSCFGDIDLLGELISSDGGVDAAIGLAVRDSWRQLMREKETDRACGTLALAIKGFSSKRTASREAGEGCRRACRRSSAAAPGQRGKIAESSPSGACRQAG